MRIRLNSRQFEELDSHVNRVWDRIKGRNPRDLWRTIRDRDLLFDYLYDGDVIDRIAWYGPHYGHRLALLDAVNRAFLKRLRFKYWFHRRSGLEVLVRTAKDAP